jgi:hypothetical protein
MSTLLFCCSTSSVKRVCRISRLAFVPRDHSSYQLTHTDPGEAVEKLPFIHKRPEDIITHLVDEVMQLINNLVLGLPSRLRICLVMDGEPLPAKNITHKKRKRHSYSFLKRARKLAHLYLAKPDGAADRDIFLKKFRTCSFGWVRWFGPLKSLITKELLDRGFGDGFSHDDDSIFSIATAAYEADPTCVAIAHLVPNSAVLSSDGDLITYPYADKAPVCSQIFVCRLCHRALVKLTHPCYLTLSLLVANNKNRLAHAKGDIHDKASGTCIPWPSRWGGTSRRFGMFLRSFIYLSFSYISRKNNECAFMTLTLQNVAKLKLVVAACLGGTDYCQNERGKSLGTSRKVLARIDSVEKADLLMDEALKAMEIPQRRWRQFFVALYQFLTLVIFRSVGRLQNPNYLSTIDISIYQDLDTPMEVREPNNIFAPSTGRYKCVGQVQRLEPSSSPSQPRKPKNRKPPTQQGPSSGRKKRTMKDDDDDDDDDGGGGGGPARKKRIRTEKTSYFSELKKHRRFFFFFFFFFFFVFFFINLFDLILQCVFLICRDSDFPWRTLLINPLGRCPPKPEFH